MRPTLGPTAGFFILVGFIWIASAHPLLEVALNEKTGNVVCPNQKVQCSSGQTCCPITSGYGCCNKANAVCCSDGVHCCDQGTTCDISGEVCIPSTSTTVSPQLAKLKLGSIPFGIKKPTDVPCPDGKNCPDDNTCCPKESGYGCCPKLNAVCCDDKIHCCPDGYTCHPPYCSPTTKKMLTIVPAKSSDTIQSSKNVVCPDQQSECPDTNTCCRLSDNLYGCCPQSNAVCCPDHKHCCPAEHSCDDGKCVSKSRKTIAMQRIKYAFRK